MGTQNDFVPKLAEQLPSRASERTFDVLRSLIFSMLRISFYACADHPPNGFLVPSAARSQPPTSGNAVEHAAAYGGFVSAGAFAGGDAGRVRRQLHLAAELHL